MSGLCHGAICLVACSNFSDFMHFKAKICLKIENTLFWSMLHCASSSTTTLFHKSLQSTRICFRHLIRTTTTKTAILTTILHIITEHNCFTHVNLHSWPQLSDTMSDAWQILVLLIFFHFFSFVQTILFSHNRHIAGHTSDFIGHAIKFKLIETTFFFRSWKKKWNLKKKTYGIFLNILFFNIFHFFFDDFKFSFHWTRGPFNMFIKKQLKKTSILISSAFLVTPHKNSNPNRVMLRRV